MAKPRHTREEINKAYNRHCRFGCSICLRACQFAGGYNHRFDCCGVVVAHVMGDNLEPFVSAGPPNYFTGPSTTTRSEQP